MCRPTIHRSSPWPGEMHRQRRVGRPARVGGAAAPHEARVHHEPAEQEQPERGRVQPREGHVAGADLQRHEVVAERRHHGHDEQEDHRRAVHREQAVVGLRRHHRVVRVLELEPDHERHQPAHREEEEGGVQVEDPDPLVVDRGHPRPQAGGGPDRGGRYAGVVASVTMWSGLLQLGGVGVPVGLRDHLHGDHHRGVAEAAELRALAAEGAGAGGLEPGRVRLAGDGVDLRARAPAPTSRG